MLRFIMVVIIVILLASCEKKIEPKFIDKYLFEFCSSNQIKDPKRTGLILVDYKTIDSNGISEASIVLANDSILQLDDRMIDKLEVGVSESNYVYLSYMCVAGNVLISDRKELEKWYSSIDVNFSMGAPSELHISTMRLSKSEQFSKVPILIYSDYSIENISHSVFVWD